MAKLHRVKQIMEVSGIDTLVVISIPLASDLMVVSRDFFPPYFRGWCATTIHQTPKLSGIQEMDLKDAYEEAPGDIWYSRASFAIESCPVETVERFALEYEARTNCQPGDENELIVFSITL